MPNDAPAFDFYPERWLSGVAMFSDAEQLAYLRLLCHQWLNDGLPDDLATLKRLGGRGVTSALLAKFPRCERDGQRRNPRLETIRTEQRDRIARRRAQRQEAAMARWHPASAREQQPELPLQPVQREHIPQVKTGLSAPPVHAAASAPHCGGHAHHPPITPHLKENNRSSGADTSGSWRMDSPAPAPETGGRPPQPKARPGLQEVKDSATTLRVPPECAEKFWNSMEASGWIHRYGQPVRDWLPLFRNFATAWKANDRQRSATAATGSSPRGYSIRSAEGSVTARQGELPSVHSRLKPISWR